MDTGVIYPKCLGLGRYEFRLNREKACKLTRRDRGIGDLGLLEPFLDKPILERRLPVEPDDWPSFLMIRKANEDRDIRIEMF